MANEIKKIVLPYAVPSKERFRPFSKDMEMAAIFILAERDRKKGEGRVRKKPEEKMTFIAETCYPIWLVPWNGRTLILDGMEFTKQTILYDTIPDIKAFETDIQASSKSREAYVAAVSQNASYFQSFTGKEEEVIEGLIADPDFVQDLMDYLKDEEGTGASKTSKAMLAPMLDEKEVEASVDKLSDLRKMIEREIKSLSDCMKLLSTSSREQVKDLHADMRKSEKEFDKQIRMLKPKVMAKIKSIQEKRDEDVTRISKKYSRKLRYLHQNRVSAERTLERLAGEIDRVEADIKGCRERKDEPNEFQLVQKLDEIKKRIPALKKEIKDIDGKLVNVEDAKKIEVARARTRPDDRIEGAMQSLHDLEAAKEAKARIEEQELTDLEDITSGIIKQIDAMIKEKENALNAINSIGADEKRRKLAIVYVPCYFVCYETEVGKRYVVYPPATISSMGIKTKLKGVFGSGKMNSFLQYRSQAISDLLDRLIDLTQENPVFEKEIAEAGQKADILQTTELLVGVKRGIKELKEEGWISENEVEIRDEIL